MVIAYGISKRGDAYLRNLARFVCVQPRYNMLFRQIERELLPLCAEEHLGVISYNPLAAGLLTGKHHQATKPKGGRFTLGSAGAMYQERYWHDREFATVSRLVEAVRDSGLSLTTTAVAWVLANPVITSAIIGASRPDQLKDVIAAAEATLDADLMVRLGELTQSYRMGDAAR